MDLDSMSRLHLDQIRVYQTHEIKLEVQVLDSGFNPIGTFSKPNITANSFSQKRTFFLKMIDSGQEIHRLSNDGRPVSHPVTTSKIMSL